jgi:hypothetical protein
VSLKDGQVQFFDAAGKAFLSQASESIAPVDVDGKPFLAIKQGFNHGTRDAYYGLGQHQNAPDELQRRRRAAGMQHNMIIAVPFVVSDKNYGLLWDNNDQPLRRRHALRLAVARPEAGRRPGQGRRPDRALLRQRQAGAHAPGKGHRLPVPEGRGRELAEGTGR